ncbi:unnamed protein product [Prorocentrum cordatum]|uniref:At4g15545-like C-terminal domain-containing protein n=1 Tax=Prorocentrum cordatum TaxID=2364126 RepID=A0ABN9YGI6_9DINO|nr:unnamed protein product [Polarella glacialis]
MNDEFLRNATPITSAECGFGGASSTPGRGGTSAVASAAGLAHDAAASGAGLRPSAGAAEPAAGAPDGKFFRQARSRLSYEAFNLFLASIKRLNSQQQTREETLGEARRIFGPELQDMYRDFEALLNSHGM